MTILLRYALALGSNLGNRLLFLQNAVDAMVKEVSIESISRVYQTAPMYVDDQPCFLNAAAVISTHCPPHDMLVQLKRIENTVGREMTFRHGPRQVDVDIVLCQDAESNPIILNDDRLHVPHQCYRERAFVLCPLAEIAGEWLDPGSGKTVSQLAQQVNRHGIALYERGLAMPNGQRDN